MHHAPSENLLCPRFEGLCFAQSLAVVERALSFVGKTSPGTLLKPGLGPFFSRKQKSET